MDDSIIQMVLDSNWTDLTRHVEKRAANKITDRIATKKEEIRDRFNAGYDTEPSDEVQQD